MVKRALKFAIGPGIGLAVGNVFFRIRFPELYNETWPPLLLQALLYLVAGYVVCFPIILLFEWINRKIKNSK